MGGDLRHLDAPTMALLTNPEVIAVNQASMSNRPLFLEDGIKAWTAEAAGGGRYLARFNLHDDAQAVGVALRHLGLSGAANVRDLWTRTDLGSVTDRFAQTLPPHGAGLYWLS